MKTILLIALSLLFISCEEGSVGNEVENDGQTTKVTVDEGTEIFIDNNLNLTSLVDITDNELTYKVYESSCDEVDGFYRKKTFKIDEKSDEVYFTNKDEFYFTSDCSLEVLNHTVSHTIKLKDSNLTMQQSYYSYTATNDSYYNHNGDIYDNFYDPCSLQNGDLYIGFANNFDDTCELYKEEIEIEQDESGNIIIENVQVNLL